MLAAMLKTFNVTISVLLRDVGKKAQLHLATLLSKNNLNSLGVNNMVARTLFLAIRFCIVTIGILAIFLIRPSQIQNLTSSSARFYFLRSALGLIVMYSMYVGYVILDDAFSLAIAIGASEPVFSVIISSLLGYEKEYKTLIGCISIVSLGVFVKYLDLITGAQFVIDTYILTKGVVILLISNLLCASKHHLEKHLAKDNPLTVTFYTCIFTNTILMVAIFIFGLFGINVGLDIVSKCDYWVKWTILLSAGLVFITLALGSWVARRLDTDVVVVLGNMSIPVEMIYSRIFGNKVITLGSFLGAAYIIIGVLLISKRQQLKNSENNITNLPKFRQTMVLWALIIGISFILFCIRKFLLEK